MWGWSGRKREAAPASPAQEDEVVLIPEAENTVRVFPFPVFEPEVQRLQVEHAIAAEPIDSRSFVTSSLSEKIGWYSIPEEGGEARLTKQFSMVTLSRALHYLPDVDWLVSLEKDPDLKSVARIYLDWRQTRPPLRCEPQRNSIGEIVALTLRVRDAGASEGPAEDEGEHEGRLMRENVMKAQAEGIQYVELPLDRNVRRMAVCGASGKFAVATRHSVQVWAYTATRLELAYTATVDFEVIRVALYEDYLALSSLTEVRVLKVGLEKGHQDFSTLHHDIIVDERDPIDSSPLEPYTAIEDEQMLECNFDSAGVTQDVHRNIIVPTMSPGISRPRLAEMARALPGQNTVFEVLGANHCRLVVPNSACHYRLSACTTLIHRQFVAGTLTHSLQFLPEHYLVPEQLGMEAATSEERRARVLSNIHKQTGLAESEIFCTRRGQINTKSFDSVLARVHSPHSLRLLIGTGRKGFLYDVRDPRLLSEYSFTDMTMSVCASKYFIYTLTEASIVIWSMRPCSAAGERFPPPCVMGMESIRSPRALVPCGDRLLVIPKLHVQEDARTDTVRSQGPSDPILLLQQKSLDTLYESIREFALLNKQSSYESYFQLMLELYFLLSTRLQLLNERLIHTGYYRSLIYPDSRYAKVFDAARQQTVQHLQRDANRYYEQYRDICAALGDYHFRSSIFSRGAIFFAESDRPVSEVLGPMMPLIRARTASSARRAVIHYLDAVLFDSDKSAAVLDETPALANQIIALYAALARHKLASVLLETSLTQHDQSFALALLRDNRPARANSTPTIPPLDGEEVLPGLEPSPQSGGITLKSIFVRALLCLELDEPSSASADLLSLEPEVIVEFCEQNPQLMLPDLLPVDTYDLVPLASRKAAAAAEDSPTSKPRTRKRCASILRSLAPSTASPVGSEPRNVTLGQLMYRIDPWSLLEVLVRVREYVPVSAALRLLHAEQLEDLSDEMSFLLECYLEWVLLDSGFPSEEAYLTLVKLYSRRVLPTTADIEYCPPVLPDDIHYDTYRQQVRRKWLTAHRNSFIDERAEWLNLIPPFDTTTHFASRSPFSDADEEPAAPRFYLQKLQGLLSKHTLAPEGSAGPIFDTIRHASSLDGHGQLSLRLLCLPIKGDLMSAIELVVQRCPEITCSYATDYCCTNSDWRQVLEFLATKADGAVYTEILSYLVQVQDPVSFLTLLPEDGDMALFLPYIEQCFRFHYASLLKTSIGQQARTRYDK